MVNAQKAFLCVWLVIGVTTSVGVRLHAVDHGSTRNNSNSAPADLVSKLHILPKHVREPVNFGAKASHANPCVSKITVTEGGMGFYADLWIGGYKQKAIIDTGSFDPVVEGNECNTCAGANYFRSKSPTADDVIVDNKRETRVDKITYGSGSVKVRSVMEEISVEGCNDFKARVPIYEVVQNLDASIIEKDKHMSAIIGVAPGSRDGPGNHMLRAMNAERFSICLPLDLAGKDSGVLVWDDKDPKHMPTYFQHMSVLGHLHWGVKLTSPKLRLGDMSWPLGGCNSGCGNVVDTGTSLFLMPAKMNDDINDYLEQWGLVDCDGMSKFPSFEMELGGVIHTITPDVYLADVEDDASAFESDGSYHGHVFTRLMAEKRMRHAPLKYTNRSSTHKQDLRQSRRGVMDTGYCVLLFNENVGYEDTQLGPMTITGMPFFRKYYTTFELSDNQKERHIYTAPVDAHCNYEHDKGGGPKRFLERPGSRMKLHMKDVEKMFRHQPKRHGPF